MPKRKAPAPSASTSSRSWGDASIDSGVEWTPSLDDERKALRAEEEKRKKRDKGKAAAGPSRATRRGVSAASSRSSGRKQVISVSSGLSGRSAVGAGEPEVMSRSKQIDPPADAYRLLTDYMSIQDALSLSGVNKTARKAVLDSLLRDDRVWAGANQATMELQDHKRRRDMASKVEEGVRDRLERLREGGMEESNPAIELLERVRERAERKGALALQDMQDAWDVDRRYKVDAPYHQINLQRALQRIGGGESLRPLAPDSEEEMNGKGRRHPTLRGLALIADADGEWAVNLAREPAITITHDDGRNVYREEYALNGVAHLPTARDWANDQLRYILNPLTGRVDRDRRALTIQNLRAEVQGMLQTLRADVAPPPPLQPRSRRPAPQPTPSDIARMQRAVQEWSSQSGSPPPEDSGEGGDYVPGTEQGEREVWTGKKGRKRARKTSGETAPGTSRSHAAKRSRSESPLPPQFARKSSARRAPSVITISSGSSGSRLGAEAGQGAGAAGRAAAGGAGAAGAVGRAGPASASRAKPRARRRRGRGPGGAPCSCRSTRRRGSGGTARDSQYLRR
eukprot:jgi/Mesvir1/11641/Mv00042-RA.1